MDNHTFDVLNYKQIVEKVSKLCSTKIANELAKKISPVANKKYIEKRLEEASAGKELIKEFGVPPFGGIKDLREIIKNLKKESVLSIENIVDIRDTLYGIKRLNEYFEDVKNESNSRTVERNYQTIIDKSDELHIYSDISSAIDKIIDDFGDIKDNATKKLQSLRNDIVKIENRIKNKLEDIVYGKKYSDMLQDKLITRRDNRYVIPIRQEYKNVFSGIVHDRSSSGLTIFMEPMAVVKLNNDLREIKSEEKAEIYRILKWISRKIASRINDIELDLKNISIIDFVFARAKYSEEINGTAPELNEKGEINIIQGRHPLLKNDPVPIDVQAGKDFNTLIITGPNTGGKTVALKTVGLFVLMIESGFHIPASNKSSISVFDNVYADIGDEQSIEQNLSTFSSHMNKIHEFLKKASSRSLVLLDELGVGTDPEEGAALGISILEKFKEKKVVTIATTHYSQLKSYAYSSDGVENASVEFDIETLKPSYRLIMGVPGGSNAFEIALRLGIPEDIINNSKEMLDESGLEVDLIINELNSERKKVRNLRINLEQKERDNKNLQEEYHEKIKKLDEKEENIIKEAKDEANNIISRLQKESKEIIRDLKEKTFNEKADIDRKDTEIHKKIKKLKRQYKDNNKDDGVNNDNIEIGDTVRVKSLGQKGEVIEINHEKEKAVIQAGILKVNVSLNKLKKAEMPDTTQEDMIKKYQLNKSSKITNKIDLRGNRYDEARHKLTKYIDNVLLAGYKEVEIIHGKGTGALREAVSEVLESHPHISSYRLGRQEEGGSGVTIAQFNQQV